jgi:hypothetical protein
MDRLHDFNQQSMRFSQATRGKTVNNSSSICLISFAVALLVGMALLIGVGSAAAQDVPSATIELSGGNVSAGIGYTWGSGELVFDGKKYPLTVNGISVLHVGVSGYTASGDVYNLTQPSDINGIYTAVSAGVAIAGGPSATAMQNSKGVVIKMVSHHAGLNFSLGPKGMSIALQ